MATLGKTDSQVLSALVGKPAWEVLLKLAAMTINELNARNVPGQNAFETLRALHIREGKVEALKEFFNGIEEGQSLTGGNEPTAANMKRL